MEELVKKYNNKKYAEVINLGKDYISSDSKNANLYRLLALSHIALSNLKEAENTYKSALKEIKNNKELLFDIGTFYLDTYKYENAIRYYEKAIKLDKNYINGINNLALAFSRKGDFEEAILNFQKVLKIDPNYFMSIFNLGLIYFKKNNLKEAEKYFINAININPSHISSYSYYGIILTAMGNLDKAENIIKKGLEIDPQSRDLRNAIANIFIKKGFTKKGRDILDIMNGFVKFEESVKKTKINENISFKNFIGTFNLKNITLCDDIINFFEERKDLHVDGFIGNTGIDHSKKKTKDISIHPIKLTEPGYFIFKEFLDNLQDMYNQYTDKYEVLKRHNIVRVSTFNIQKYESGDHFSQVHWERQNSLTSHRLLAWMIYLNSNITGGETYFLHDDKKIIPEKGKTLIWPSDWTHAHSGLEVIKGPKYILTGWIDYG